MHSRAAFVPALLALSVAGYEWRLTRGNRAVPGLLNLLVFGLCMGAAMAVPAPSELALSPGGAGVLPGLAYVLSRGLRIAAVFSLTTAALSLGRRPRGAAEPRVAGPGGRVALGTFLLCAGLFALAGPHCTGELLVVRGWRGRAALASGDVLYTAYLLWCLTVFIRLIAHHSSRIGPGPVRTGLRLIVLSAGVGMLWALWSTEDTARVLLTGHQDLDEDLVSVVLGSCCLALGALGATATAWWAPAAGPAGWLRTRRTHRALRPLWSALCTAAPQVRLSPSVATGGDGIGPRAERVPSGGSRFALYRTVIEIRDGCLAMRPHVHPQVPSWVAEHTDDAAVRDAAVLAVALDSAAAGGRGGPGPRPNDGRATEAEVSLGVGGSLDAEAAWLARVSRAFLTSPVVARCRERARAEREGRDTDGRPGTGTDG
ncbi:MAB_1171c family putative transporter [Streptomyces sp. MS06]|uniref:MAB_1171c family putative transporter n=1 Tax=Streptomyces sp. MS06 TaxID=3385974 RepID=UPI0039A334EA